MHALDSHGQRNQSDLKANTCRLHQARETRVTKLTVPEWREIFSQSHGVRVGLSIIKTCSDSRSDNQDKSYNMRQNCRKDGGCKGYKIIRRSQACL